MGHFGDCCDPFMRFRMTLNGYDAILSVATETPRCTLVVVSVAQTSPRRAAHATLANIVSKESH